MDKTNQKYFRKCFYICRFIKGLMAEENQNSSEQEKETAKKNKPKKKSKKKFIYYSILLIIAVASLAMLLFSVHINRPSVSKVSEYSSSTFIYEIEYYLVELGFYKLHSFFQESPTVEIKMLESDKTISVQVQENSLVMSNTEIDNPDISIYTYESVLKSLREASSREELIQMVKKYIDTEKIVVVPHKTTINLILKGYLSLAYLL